MGLAPERVCRDLRTVLGLGRAVETGTHLGQSAATLAGIFPTVVTIELSPEYHERASRALEGRDNVRLVLGDSRSELSRLAREDNATLYFLDGHWCGFGTAGQDSECPVLEELAAIGPGHPDDCVIVDDARLFAAPPGEPHDPDQWPTLLDVFDAIRAHRPEHHITVLGDQIIAVPPRAKPVIDSYGQRMRSDAQSDRGGRRILDLLRRSIRPSADRTR